MKCFAYYIIAFCDMELDLVEVDGSRDGWIGLVITCWLIGVLTSEILWVFTVHKLSYHPSQNERKCYLLKM